MKNLALVILIAVAAHLLGEVTCSAATITFTNSAAFNAALTAVPMTVEGYETYPVNSTISNGTLLNGVTYVAFPTGTDGRIDNTFNRIGNQSLALERPGLGDFFFPGDALSLSFSSPVFAVGIFFNVSISPANSLSIATPVGTASTGGPIYDMSTLYFAGLISDVSFTSATIGSSLTSSGYNLDNLTFTTNQVSVPEQLGFFGPAAILAFLFAAHLYRRKMVL